MDLKYHGWRCQFRIVQSTQLVALDDQNDRPDHKNHLWL